MKKNRFTALVLAFCMMFSSMPFTAFAEDEMSPVMNVKECKSWDLVRSRYITYTINGMECDSREMGAAFNLAAYNQMTTNDKKKVANWMVNAGYSGRVRQFGENGAEVLMDRYNTDTGWKALWAQFEKNIESHYCKDLQKYYGGTDEDSTKYYAETIDSLMEFPEGSAAYTVLHDSKYYYAFEAREFLAEHEAIEELLQDGRESYLILSNSMLSATQAAVKGSSKELIGLICDKALVPAITPSSSISSTAKDIFSAALEFTDRITGYSGKLQDAVIGKTTDGAAAKSQIDYFTYIANANRDLAQHCYSQALALHNKMLSDAPDIIAEIDKNEAHKYKNGRDGEVEKLEKTEQAESDAVNARYANISANTSPYSGMEVDKDYKARENLEKDIQSWANKMTDQAETILKEVGFCAVSSNEERNSVDPEQYIGTYILTEEDGKKVVKDASFLDLPQTIERQALENDNAAYTSSAFDKFITEEGMLDLAVEKDRLLKYYQNHIDSIASAVDLYKPYRENFIGGEVPLIAKGKGYDKHFNTEYCKKYVTWEYVTTNKTARATWASSAVSLAADKRSMWQMEDVMDTINKNYQWYLEKYNAKQERDEILKQRGKKIADEFESFWNKYASEVQKEQKLLDNGLPNYVYGDTVKIYSDGDGVQTLAGGFDINNATPLEFKAEAKNLAAAYDKFARYDAEREQAEMEFRSVFREVDRYMYSGVDTNIAFGNMSEKVSKISNDYLNVRYTGEFNISSQQNAYAEKTRTLWCGFDSMAPLNLSLKNSYETFSSKVGSYKRQIKMGFMTQSGYDYYKDFYDKQIAYVEENTNLGPYFVSSDNKVTDLKLEFDNSFAELKKVLDDPTGYNPVQSIAKAAEPQSGVDAALASGEKKSLSVVFSPADASDKRVKWISSDPSVAVVDENGNVTALSSGTVTIRAEAVDSTMSQSASYSGLSYDVFTCDPNYAAEFVVTVDGGAAYLYGDATADGLLAADDAAAVLQKVLVDSYKMPIEGKTDGWLKYADVTADSILAADDAAAIMQKVLVDSYTMPCEDK